MNANEDFMGAYITLNLYKRVLRTSWLEEIVYQSANPFLHEFFLYILEHGS